MTTLSALLALEPCPPEAYGLAVDIASFSPPANLRRVGLLYQGEDGEIDLDVVDVALAYIVAGVEVVLEVPAGVKVDARLVAMAAKMEVALSLLPPDESIDEAGRAVWVASLAELTVAWLGQADFARGFHPASAVVEHMFVEALRDGPCRFIPSETYVIDAFVSRVSPELRDAAVTAVRERVIAHFGGADEFRAFARTMARRIHTRVGGLCADQAAKVAA